MSKEVTAEQMYNEYHQQIMFYTKGIHPRKIVNFEKIRKKDTWVNFEVFADMVNRNNLNYELFIEALVNFSKGWFSPTLLGHKGIRLYK